MSSDPRPLAAVVGRHLRRVREDAKITAEEVAEVARHLGIGWSRPTIVRLELGQHRLDAEMLITLPLVYGHACNRSIGPRELILGPYPEDDDSPIALEGGLKISGAAAYGVLTGTTDVSELKDGWPLPTSRQVQVAVENLARYWERLVPGITLGQAEDMEEALAREGIGEPEQKLARKLKMEGHRHIGAREVALIARHRFGRSLAEERDARIAEREDADEMSARSLQAVRGRVTRDLAQDLMPDLERFEQQELDRANRKRRGRK